MSLGGDLVGTETTAPTEGATEPTVWGLIGNTPLIPIATDAARDAGGRLFLKAEWLNPGGSVKDRPAREIMRVGLAEGALPRKRLLDASSGNTAVAYAMLGAAARIGVTVCVPANASSERFRLLAVFGAQVVETDPLEGSDGAIRRARELAAAEPERYWYADQYGNRANPDAHYHTTGPEIWRQTGGAITHFVAGVGTSGTLMGAGRFLKEKCSDVQLISVEPDAAFHGLEGMKHMASALVPGIYDPSLMDRQVFVDTESAESAVRTLAQERGLFVGWSTGAALVASDQLFSEGLLRSDATVVAVAPDGGGRYLSDTRRWVGVGVGV